MRNSSIQTSENGTILAVIPFCLLLATLVSAHLWSLVFQTWSIMKTTRETRDVVVKNLSILASDLDSQTKSGCFQSLHYQYCLQLQADLENVSSDTPVKIDWETLLEGSQSCAPTCKLTLQSGKHAFVGSLRSPIVECLEQPCSLAATESILIERLAINAPTLIVASRDITIGIITVETNTPVALTIISTQGQIEISEILGPLALNLYGTSLQSTLSQSLPNGVMAPQLQGVLAIWPLTLD